MTNKELKQLKRFVSKLPEQDSPAELDQAILHQAAQKSAQTKTRHWSAGFNQLAPITASVVITIGVFFAMGELVKNRQQSISTNTAMVEIDVDESTSTDPVRERIKRPSADNLAPTEAPTTRQTKSSELLSDLTLPSTRSVIANMDFAIDSDRTQAYQAIDVAMVEIRSMIKSGAEQDARWRYEQLLRSCSVCQLPANLEALALKKPAALPEKNQSSHSSQSRI